MYSTILYRSLILLAFGEPRAGASRLAKASGVKSSRTSVPSTPISTSLRSCGRVGAAERRNARILFTLRRIARDRIGARGTARSQAGACARRLRARYRVDTRSPVIGIATALEQARWGVW